MLLFPLFPVLPNIQSISEQQTALLGTTVNIQCEVESYPPAEIIWRKDGVNRGAGMMCSDSGVSDGPGQVPTQCSLLRFDNVTLGNGGNYTCVANNTRGQDEANTTLTVVGMYVCTCAHAMVAILAISAVCSIQLV